MAVIVRSSANLSRPASVLMSTEFAPVSFAPPPRRLFAALAKRAAIGIVAPGYGTEKVSYGLAPEGYSFHKLFRVPLQRLERRGTFWAHTPLLLDHPVELVHAFNELPLGVRPFIVSFENELPRYLGDPPAWQLDAGYALLSSSRCRKILSLSNAAAAALKSRLLLRGLDEAASKVSVFRGSVLANDPSQERSVALEHARGRPLRVLFVGRDALRKGLLPTLDALDMCRAAGAEVEATVVCDFAKDTYIGTWNDADTAKAKARMAAMAGVTHHERLPNAEIHRLMRTHDVLVFPTLDESLGWVAIEAAMAGMPVVTTDIFALPELVVDGRTGVLISLTKNETQRWVGLWQQGRAFEGELARAFDSMRVQIGAALLRFVENPALIRSLGDAARLHIESLYGFAEAQQSLARVYREALAA